MDDFGLTRGNVQKYSPGVLVGNWYEDMTLREDQLKVYRGQKGATSAAGQQEASAAGATYTTTTADHLQEPTEISASVGDEVRFGQPYLVEHVQTHAALALDVEPKGNNTTSLLSAASAAGPQVRSTWTLHRCKDEHNVSYNRNKADVLHYGQRVRLANENARAEGFVYVQSSLQSGLRSSQTQYAAAALNATADSVFVVARPGAVREDLQNGAVVKVGDAVVLLHSLTNLPLACTGARVGTSFGMEYAVTCEYVSEHFSRSRSAVVTRQENIFAFSAGEGEAAPRQATLKSTAAASQTLSMTTGSGVAELMERIRAGALQIGGRIGFRSLAVALGVACNEQRQRRLIDRNGLRSAIARLGVRLTPVEVDVLVKRFDVTGNNVVCAQDLLAEVRGTTTQERLRAVLYAYQQLTVEGKGSVEFAEMQKLFSANAGALPDVVDGLLRREEAIFDFESCWPGRVGCKVGTVTLDEFVEYYNDMSPAEESDERFCATVEAAWAIPPTAAYLTAGPRRVITVVHDNDTTEQVPIPDSLVVDTRDTAAVRRLLVQHGLTNVKDFRISERM